MTELVIITAVGVASALALAFLLPKPASVASNRLQDLSVTDSAYGNNIPFGIGQIKVSADLIYSREIDEQSEKSGGGKGGGPSVTEYSYFLTAIYGVMEGPIREVTRIWLDKHLYYDQTGTSDITIRDGFVFRLAKGTDTQTSDPMQITDHGAAISPGYRGICTIAVENLEITDLGRRPPTMEVEINGAIGGLPSKVAFVIEWGEELQETLPALPGESWSSTADYVWGSGTDFLGEALGNTLGNNYLGIIAYFAKQLRDAGAGATEITLIFEKRRWSSGFPPTENNPSWNNVVYDDNDDLIYVRFAASDITITSYGTVELPGTNPSPFGAPPYNGLVEALAHMDGGYIYDHIVILGYRQDDDRVGAGELFANNDAMVAAYEAVADSIQTHGARLHFWNVDTGGIIERSDSEPPPLYIVPYFRMLDSNDFIEDLGHDFLVSSSGFRHWWISHQYYAETSIIRRDLSNSDDHAETLTIYDSLTYDPNVGIDGLAEWFVDAWFAQFSGTGADTAPIADIIRELMTRVGYVENVDYDVSAITEEAMGFLADSQESVADLLEDILAYYFLIVVEQDGKLVFKKRVTTSIDTINVNEFVDNGDDPPYEITFTDDSELPFATDISYYNPIENYESGSAHWQRPKNPDQIVEHNEILSLSAPLVMMPDDAKQIALKWTYLPWIEREKIRFKVSHQKLLWNPGDIITIQFEDASTRDARIDTADLGADWVIEITATFVDLEALSSFTNVDASGGDDSDIDTIPNPPTSEIIVLDSPLLRDGDAQAGISVGYYMMGPNTDGVIADWKGATAWRTDDLASYTELAISTIRFVRGSIAVATPDPIDLWRTDTVNSIVVDLESGVGLLSSISRTELLNGGNGAIIFKSNGEFEIIQYQDVSVTGVNQVTLTNILRGRRGTDTMATGHGIDEVIYFLRPASLQALTTDFAYLGATRNYRAVSFGRLFESAIDTPFIQTGRDLYPYAPVRYAIQKDIPGAGDLTISWSERQRYNTKAILGQWKHPEVEETKSFEIDILDAPGGSVVRTLTSSTTSVVYTSAQRVTDGFDPIPATLDIIVYKMSALVGRGYGQEMSVEII